MFTAIETAAFNLSGNDAGPLHARLFEFSKQIEDISKPMSELINKLKRKIERRIVKKRGDFAHKGVDLTQRDLLPSYETALEFFWHYEDFKQLAQKLRN